MPVTDFFLTPVLIGGAFSHRSISHGTSWWVLDTRLSLVVMPSTSFAGVVAGFENKLFCSNEGIGKNMLELCQNNNNKKIKW